MGVATLVMLIVGSFVLAETVRGTITKIDDDKITVTVREKGKKGKGEKKEYKYKSDKIKFTFKKDKDDEGTKKELKDVKTMLKDAKEAGLNATLEVDDDTVTEVTLRPARKGGGKGKKKVDD